MKIFKIILVSALLPSCTVYAHPRPATPPVVVPAPQVNNVRAWVWVSARAAPHGSWVRGHWEQQTVPRHMLSRHPHTHVRYVKGRMKPRRPHRRHR